MGAVRRIASKSLGVKGLSNEHLKKINNSCMQILSQGPMNWKIYTVLSFYKTVTSLYFL